jgi:hypothetical protein
MIGYQKTVYVASGVKGFQFPNPLPKHVVLEMSDGDEPELRYYITGTAFKAEQSDIDDPAKLNAQVTKDIGVGLLEILNDGGLALAYGESFKAPFQVRKGRADTATIAMNTFAAFKWFMTNSPARVAELNNHPLGDVAYKTAVSKMVQEWIDAGSPK